MKTMNDPALTIDGVEIRVDGDGPDTILMIHGWPDTCRLWDRQVESLRRQYRCVRFTIPGFDPAHEPRAHALDELVDFVGRVVEQACAGGPVTLLLHDWGCFFGYQFALRHPERVRRIVGVDVGDAGSRRFMKETGLKAKLAIIGYQLWLAVAWRIGGRAGDSMARRMAVAFRAPCDPASVHAQMGYPYYIQWTGALGGYRRARRFTPACPMLFIFGRRKPFMFHSAAWASDVASRPGSRVLAFDTGHWVMAEAPDAFDRAVTEWLAATDAAS